MKDFLIIGQGVAGSFLAWELLKQKREVVIVDDNHKSSSSMVSAGLINPVTGKRFVVTEGFEKFYEFAKEIYRELEEEFDEVFLIEKKMLRIFKNNEERDQWIKKDDNNDAKKYCQENQPGITSQNKLNDSFGSLTVDKTGQCRTARLLTVFREYFLKQNIFLEKETEYNDLMIKEGYVQFNGEKFKTVIFCEGYKGEFNPWFDWVPFNSAKGEILKIQIDGINSTDTIINCGKWCIPLENSLWAAGANYIWDHLDCEPTEKGRKEIVEGLGKYMKSDIRVVEHKAGVRPVVRDQKVVLGKHPEIESLAIFNGLGSKGFLQAPFYAHHLAEYLCKKTSLTEDINVNRFFKKNKR